LDKKNNIFKQQQSHESMKYWHMMFVVFFLFFLISCAEKLSVFVQFDNTCNYEEYIDDVQKIIRATSFTIIKTELSFSDIRELENEECVVRTFHPKDLPKIIESLEKDFENENTEKFRQARMNKSLIQRDISDKEKLREYLKAKHSGTTATLEYQLYVTPDADAVQNLISQLSGIQEIYDESLSWTWVSEEYLNDEEEYWYTPEEFLTKTPEMMQNPTKGTPASDCSEKANTLVSLLLASGYSAENVRVVLGLVDFDGELGGHAWVEIYENEQWLVLDPTAGASYDEETETYIPAAELPYTYFEYHPYPSREVWYYYNNVYYSDLTAGTSNAPAHWKESSKSRLRRELGVDAKSKL
jgi:hypothetical protein